MGNQLWTGFLRFGAERSNRGSIRSLDGVEAAWVHSASIINNGTYLTSPAATNDELRGRMDAACADAAAHALPWAFFVYSQFVNGLNVAAVAESAGLAHFIDIQVMTGDLSTLREPVRSAPPVEYRRIVDRDATWKALDINMRSYGMPPEMTESLLDSGAYYCDTAKEFGFLAYVGDVAVSTATVIAIDGWLYVALVATDPAHRQKGHAEAVMRHALSVASAELGITRTALDASAMGAPIYERMGYQFTGERWSMFAPAH